MTSADRRDLLARDAACVWHPYTQHETEPAPIPVAEAHGSRLVLEDGRELIDAISSWWACLHGHGHPRIVEAFREQVGRLDHVLFAGATHEPAVALAEDLVRITPERLERVFFSDDGSTAVEVALKMVAQAWLHAGEPERRVFLCFDGAYHGDTFGAMAVGDPDPFFLPFGPMLFEARRAPLDTDAIAQALDGLGGRAAGVIVEPLVQGAAGMVMHDVELLRTLRAQCDERGIPLIADEVMTGFGRTGALFACQRAGISPDLLCLAKGLTAGCFPLSATLATGELFASFLSESRAKAFFHGHTFTANPIGCSVARASIALCEEEDTPGQLQRIGDRIHTRLAGALEGDARASGLRQTGGIVAFDIEPPVGETSGYLATMAPELRRRSIEAGVLLRPLGNVLYAMPPSCTSEEECDRIADAMVEILN